MEEGTWVAEGTPAGHTCAGNLLVRIGSREKKTTERRPSRGRISTMTCRGSYPKGLRGIPRRGRPIPPDLYRAFLRGLWSPSAGTWAPGRLGTGCRRGVDSSVSCTCADPTRETVHGPERPTVHTVPHRAHRALVSMRGPSLLGAAGSKRCDSRRVVEDQPWRNMATYHAVVGRMLDTHSIRIAVVVLLMELALHVFSKSLVRRGPSRSVAARVRRGNAETELTRTRTARDRHWDPPGRSRS